MHLLYFQELFLTAINRPFIDPVAKSWRSKINFKKVYRCSTTICIFLLHGCDRKSWGLSVMQFDNTETRRLKRKMYCLQWLIPVLLIPKHWLHPSFLIDQAIFMWLYVFSFFVQRRPCHICSFIFFSAVGLLCWNDSDSCVFWPSCKTALNGEICAYVLEKKNWLS